MTNKEAQARSQEKVTQILSLMKTLHIESIIKRRITEEGFIEDMILYVDNEKYQIDPEPEVKEVETSKDPEQAPKEEVHEAPTE